MTETIAEGDRLPDAELLRLGSDGPETVSVAELTARRRVVLFAVPGAFTPTCHSAHMPSFVRTAEDFRDKGVDAICCVAVNDPFVLRAWGEASGAPKAGIEMLSDPVGAFTEALGMGIDAPGAWIGGRSRRYAMLIEDGAVRVLRAETSPGACDVSGGEGLLEAI
jgi:cytochrome c peroxidase